MDGTVCRAIPPALAAELPQAPPPIEAHAITRARQRYGLELTLGDLHEAEKRIELGDSLLMRRCRDSSSEHILRIAGVACRVIVGQDGRIKTFMPAGSKISDWQGAPRRGKKKRSIKRRWKKS